MLSRALTFVGFERLVLNLGRELGVILFVDELVQLARILDPHAKKPSSAIGIVVDQVRVLQCR